MAYSVSLEDYTPSARFGGADAWTQVRFEGSAVRSGPWTSYDTQALDPVDTDPEDPESRDLTTEAITIYPGWLRVVFLDEDGNQEPTEPVFVGSTIRPAVSEIANLMPDRTTIAGGGEAGTFTASTRPTAAQVDSVIDLVIDTVDPLVPEDAESETLRTARSVVALQTAILIETGHFGEQTEVNERRVEVWQTLLERHLAILDASAREDVPGGVRAYGVPITTVLATSSPASTELLP